MADLEQLIQRAKKTQTGFTDLKRAADEFVAGHSAKAGLRISKQLFRSEVHQARMLATLIFGQLAAKSAESLNFLRSRVSRDEDWRVQEMLAQAFDRYCADTGYEQALSVIEVWLADPKPQCPPSRDGRAENLDEQALFP